MKSLLVLAFACVLLAGCLGGDSSTGYVAARSGDACRNVSYTVTTCESVPFIEQACTQEPLKYSKSLDCVDGLAKCTITNLDSQSGSFQVVFGNGVAQSQFIEAGGLHLFELAVASGCSCAESFVPTKTVCKETVTEKKECTEETKTRVECD
ncbi:MAG: hypothetical protein V1834_02955 [Candidatus Micrarchaeota archaeon]